MDVAIWTEGALRHTEVFAYAGNVVTNDIAFAFGTPLASAEEIKIKYGSASSELLNADEAIDVPSVGGRPSRSLQRQTLSDVIEPRYTELMGFVNKAIESVQEQLHKDNIKHHIAAGIVLTGGAAKMDGLIECAEKVFNNQVRIGAAVDVTGLTDYVKDAQQSTAVGLLQYAKESQIYNEPGMSENESKSLFDGSLGKQLNKFRKWIQKEF